MKSPLSFFSALLVLTGTQLPAGVLYWDTDDINLGGGPGTGKWDSTETLWSTSAEGELATQVWVAGETAIFSAGSNVANAVVTISSLGVAIGGMEVEEGTVEFIGSNSVKPANNSQIIVHPGATISTDSSLRFAVNEGTGVKLYLDGSTLKTTNSGAAGSFFDQDIEIVLNAGGGTFTHITQGILNIVETKTKISGAGGLTKSGAGVLAIASITGNNTYAGPTIVNEGELRMRSNTNPLPITTALTVTAPGIFNLNTISQQVGSLSGDGTVGLGKQTLTVGNATNTTFTGSIKDVANAGANGTTNIGGNITKVGTGTLTLAGSNEYTGTTTVRAGRLALQSSLQNSLSVIVEAGELELAGDDISHLNDDAALVLRNRASLIFSGSVQERAGTLTIGANEQTIDFGNGVVQLTVVESKAIPWAGTVLIKNWSGAVAGGGTDQLIVVSASATIGLTAAQLAAITFVDPAGFAPGSYPAVALSTGEIVPQASTPAPPFEQWQQTEFGTNSTNPAVAGLSADPDHDGYANLLEYGLLTNPNATGPIISQGESNGRLTLAFQRNTERNDLNIRIQSAEALTGPWVDEAVSLLGAQFTVNNQAELSETGATSLKSVFFTDGLSIGTPAQRYLRIKAEKP